MANLASRFRYIEGPPFGGGQYVFEYRGDAQALNEALEKFAAIRAPNLDLVIHEGGGRPSAVTAEEQAARVDWTFTVWVPQSYYSLMSDVRNRYNAQQGFFVPCRSAAAPVPRMDVYASRVNWDDVKIPEVLAVSNERAATPAPATPESTSPSGAVSDMATGKPIPGASVSAFANARDKTPGNVGPVTTDENGEFRLDGASAVGHFVAVHAEGYAARKAGNYFEDGDLYRAARTTSGKLAVYMSKSTALAGRVTDPDGNPIPGIEVHARHPFGINGERYPLYLKLAAVTDGEGRFRIDGLPEGIVYLLCWGEWYTVSTFQPYPAPADNVHLTVVRATCVKGRLVDELGDPVAGEVSLTEATDRIGRFASEARSGDDGLFEIRDVPPGEYVLSSARMRYWRQEDPTAQTVVLKAGETVEVTASASPSNDDGERENTPTTRNRIWHETLVPPAVLLRGEESGQEGAILTRFAAGRGNLQE